MKRKKLDIFGITILVLLLIWSSCCTQVMAAVVWSDDFSDGNIDDWTILEGSFDTPTGPKYALTASQAGLNMIYHTSNQVYGTWLLEMYEDRVSESDIEVLFIATGSTLDDFAGYSIYLLYGSTSYGISLLRWNYTHTKFTLDHYFIWRLDSEVEPPATGWYFYNITRTTTGDFFVSRGSESIMNSTPEVQEWQFDDVIEISDKFVVKSSEAGSIDTVVVGTDLPPITITTDTSTQATYPTTSGTTELTNPPPGFISDIQIIAIAGVGLVLVIVIALFTKKR